jgi:hypothetical protein
VSTTPLNKYSFVLFWFVIIKNLPQFQVSLYLEASLLSLYNLQWFLDEMPLHPIPMEQKQRRKTTQPQFTCWDHNNVLLNRGTATKQISGLVHHIKDPQSMSHNQGWNTHHLRFTKGVVHSDKRTM